MSTFSPIKKKCEWESIKQGITVLPLASITLASFGTFISLADPTSRILDPKVTTTLFSIGDLPVPSISVPLVITMGLSNEIAISPP
ncbi:hypothetical protein [Candidatus Borrarchaeum sp.]|uniref:hypothetical protein n=1 Tax=Candidatus Borrarchaeum sp. TaxID=2846742 RepID=UPI00257E9B4C|nr:hypothetical protein [Candidatus Borrarchaeum sp.]